MSGLMMLFFFVTMVICYHILWFFTFGCLSFLINFAGMMKQYYLYI